ncbi:MAG: porin family protein, partial [Balneolaceae bacterium]|nr:porin family protein [Balneolaceae bacterium]
MNITSFTKKLSAACMIVLAGLLVVPQQASAQWSIGASYEMRQEVPENGFGVRIERSILNPVPIVDLALRAHFSYFSEENGVTESGASFGEIQNYDFGLAAIGGVSLGLLKPYVGLGLGSNTFDVSGGDFQTVSNTSESALFWNALVGAEVSI